MRKYDNPSAAITRAVRKEMDRLRPDIPGLPGTLASTRESYFSHSSAIVDSGLHLYFEEAVPAPIAVRILVLVLALTGRTIAVVRIVTVTCLHVVKH